MPIGQLVFCDETVAPAGHIGRGDMRETLQSVVGMGGTGQVERMTRPQGVHGPKRLERLEQPNVGGGVDDMRQPRGELSIRGVAQAQPRLGDIAGHRPDARGRRVAEVFPVPPLPP